MNKSEAWAVTVIALATCAGWFVAGWVIGNGEMSNAVDHAYKAGLKDSKLSGGTATVGSTKADGEG